VAIEDAGFDVRDSIAWLYGSGFPKSLDISKAIDKVNGKPRNLLEFTLWFRTTGLTVKQVTDALRSAGLISENGTMASHYFAQSDKGQPAIPTAAMWQVIRPMIDDVPTWVDNLVDRIEAEREVIGKQNGNLLAVAPGQDNDRSATTLDITAPATDEAKKWQGWGTALKPAFEPIVVARKPLVGTVAANVLLWGVGGLNIDGSRIGFASAADQASATPQGKVTSNSMAGAAPDVEGGQRKEIERPDNSKGRWPANIILDEHTAGLLDEQSGISKSTPTLGHNRQGNQVGDDRSAKAAGMYGDGAWIAGSSHADSGGASRFFYVAKASKKDRNEGLEDLPDALLTGRDEGQDAMQNAYKTRSKVTKNIHPTVKPTALMEYLVKLVTPPGGTVLDPFTGSGSTGKAALLNGFKFIGIELTADYLPIIEGRLKHAAETYANKATEEETKEQETLF
jgi:hypothetical protein